MLKKGWLIFLISIAIAVSGFYLLFLNKNPFENIKNKTEKTYPTQPFVPIKEYSWSKEGVEKVVEANNRFAFDLYAVLKEEEKNNLFYSPYSISAALAMTYEGARGETAEEIKKVFHFPEIEVLRPNFAKIYTELNKEDAYQLKTANALWIQKDFLILDNYIKPIEKYYAAKAINVDFIKETEKTREKINHYIEEQTNNKIKELITPNLLSPYTRLLITNAIYFKGSWIWQFDSKLTSEREFKITPTYKVKVPMMAMMPEKAKFNYADLEELQILELPYKGGKISMLILLPKKDLESLEPLTAKKLNQWKTKMRETKLDKIYLPKFELKSKYNLNSALNKLGMKRSFTPAADFSPITGKRDLYIGFVVHQAYVSVDEEGTEAAAATAVGMRIGSFMPSTIFLADHPFLFIIQEKETGNILFVGRVIDPRK